jgi:excinuclease ABC subunit A
VIDLGPEGGEEGGQVVFQGTPEALVEHGRGHTAHYMGGVLARAEGATA